jgi:hypothetical protein
VENISEEVLQQGVAFLEEIANSGGRGGGDPLKPLMRVLEQVVELAQLVEGFKLEPSEADLRSNSRELSGCKGKIQSLTRSYLVSDDPSLTADAHELINEASEVIGRGQKRIRRLLQRLGMLPEGSKASSLENEDAQASKPPLKQTEALKEVFSFRRSGGDWGGREGEEARARTEERARENPAREEGDLVALLRCLGGPQANDSGWPTFLGKYVEYPQFKKE